MISGQGVPEVKSGLFGPDPALKRPAMRLSRAKAMPNFRDGVDSP
jgi:hypothetical protein